MEMAEERIAERIDANLLNVTLDDLRSIPKDMYMQKVEKLKRNIVGKLKIREYPTASASVVHFRSLLNELNLKKNFVPDVIILVFPIVAVKLACDTVPQRFAEYGLPAGAAIVVNTNVTGFPALTSEVSDVK